MKTWVKVYTEILNDPKIAQLPLPHAGVWLFLLAAAGTIDDRDGNEAETGRLGTPEEVAWLMRRPLEDIQPAVDAFIELGMVHTNAGALYLTNYGKRQARPPSARPSAVRTRVKRHRAKKCNEDVTTPEQNRTEENRTEVEVEETATTCLNLFNEVRKGPINELDVAELEGMVSEFGPQQFTAAIREANLSRRGDGVNLKYIRAILSRWQSAGVAMPA